MSESRLHYLFNAYFNKIATAQERDELMELLLQSKNDEQVKAFLTQSWQQYNSQNNLFSDSKGEEMISNILQKERLNATTPVIELYKTTHSFKWMRIAAAVVILAIGGLSFWLVTKQPEQQIAQSKVKRTTKDSISAKLQHLACKRKLVFAGPHHSAACISARCGTPVTSAVRASVHCRQYSATCSKPTVCSAMNA